MMPNVNISNRNFQRLQGHAVPLVDDLDAVLARVLDVYEAQAGAPKTMEAEVPEDLTVKDFSSDSPPNLTFTSVKSIVLEGQAFNDKYWNPLLFAVIGLAAKKIGKDKLLPVLDVNYSTKEQKNFEHIPDAGIYVQGRDSNLCWRSIYKILKVAKMSVEIEFYWQDKPTAAFPGKSGRFVVEAK
ncbi:MAG: T4SS efffector SepA family protein [Xanthobacteraceae bacterium]